MSGASRAGLAFSTLACPEWDAATVVRHAADGGWDGIEWRGGRDGTVRIGWAPDARRALRASMDDAGLASIAVTTYTHLIHPDPRVVESSIDAAVAHAELAADLAAPAIRVFLGERSDDASTDALRDRAIGALDAIVARLRGSGIAVAIEPHDDHVSAGSIRPILDAVPDRALGVVWDIGNAWSIGEPPEVGLAAYGGRIHYVQVKDGTGTGSDWRLTELGAGDVPIERAITGLARDTAARGAPMPPISLEWERAWHDHLAPADEALPRAHAWLAERIAPLIAGTGR